MSLPPDAQSKSVSWVSVAAVFGCFALFLFIIYLAYLPQREKTAEADLSQVSADERWQYSAEGRASHLADLRAREQTEQTTYGWVDQKAGVVRLPIDRAMQLTLQDLQAKK
ncbi:MAG TPA: hypothetical protein VK717_06765 [Opitutaceae bacterium]|jgi:hypothetical protein|nr:hypothetical protein [Opitutaceae bacterium]